MNSPSVTSQADQQKSLLHFHVDEELQASRVAAHAARLCLEMGINRKDSHQAFKAPADTILATKLVWAVFVLDRRSSIGLGIPFVLQDSDLDASLYVPVGLFKSLRLLIH